MSVELPRRRNRPPQRTTPHATTQLLRWPRRVLSAPVRITKYLLLSHQLPGKSCSNGVEKNNQLTQVLFSGTSTRQMLSYPGYRPAPREIFKLESLCVNQYSSESTRLSTQARMYSSWSGTIPEEKDLSMVFNTLNQESWM